MVGQIGFWELDLWYLFWWKSPEKLRGLILGSLWIYLINFCLLIYKILSLPEFMVRDSGFGLTSAVTLWKIELLKFFKSLNTERRTRSREDAVGGLTIIFNKISFGEENNLWEVWRGRNCEAGRTFWISSWLRFLKNLNLLYFVVLIFFAKLILFGKKREFIILNPNHLNLIYKLKKLYNLNFC